VASPFRIPNPVTIVGDHVERAAGLDAERVVGDDGIAAVRTASSSRSDQQPVRASLAGRLAAHSHQCPVAVQFLAVQLEFEHALA
jgi:hypothetical protein